ncbi:hypothetical protein [uncultured Desulfobacter sp.]|uniref:hypothetical protein n=1 Tax=uncultured Desulfobacter sp. TaxID=240139 RepID=UPI002AA7196B|nr:hypothetical protein [uncultured Desulfobacter sp.]
MKPRKHLRLFSLVSIAWFLFWLAGLPDYYQQYSLKFMVFFDLAILGHWASTIQASLFSKRWFCVL